MDKRSRLLILQLENLHLAHRIEVAKMEQNYEDCKIRIERLRRLRRRLYRKPVLVPVFKFIELNKLKNKHKK